MERIAPDFSRFLRTPDGKAIPPTSSNYEHKSSVAENEQGPKTNLSVVFIGITLLIIAVLIFTYILNRNKSKLKIPHHDKTRGRDQQ